MRCQRPRRNTTVLGSSKTTVHRVGAMLGKPIGSDLLTLVDDGTRPKGLASRPFDGEGVPTERRVIVDRGALKGFMYNTIVAKRAGVKSTGNAARDGYASLPGIGAHNFFMAAGRTPPAEIVEATKAGLWLKDVTGYGINPVNGNFSGGASGLWIEDGKVAHPVRGLTIAGTAREMLHGIDLVGSEIDLNRRFAAPLFRHQGDADRRRVGGRHGTPAVSRGAARSRTCAQLVASGL